MGDKLICAFFPIFNISNRKKICYYFRRYHGLTPYFALLLLLAQSWYFEYITGSSIAQNFYPAIVCPIFLQASAVKELISALGFSIALIAVVYSFWNQRMLGLRYRDLVRYKFPSYHICAVLHIFSTGCCIVSATVGLSESAILSLVAVLYGFIYQAIVVYWIIWDSERCARIATQKYRQIQINYLNPNGSTTKDLSLYDYLRKISDTIPVPSDRYYHIQIKCFAEMLVTYSILEIRREPVEKTSPQLLAHITNAWKAILHSPGAYDETNDNILLVVDIFSNAAQSHSSESKMNSNVKEQVFAWNKICCGYIICRLIELRKSLSEQDTYKQLYWEISRVISMLPSKVPFAYIQDALSSLLVTLMLSSFTAHSILYNPDAVEIYRKCKNEMKDIDPNTLWIMRRGCWLALQAQLKNTITLWTDLRCLDYIQKI